MSESLEKSAYPEVVPLSVQTAINSLPKSLIRLNERLKRELDKKLVYHCYFHTIDVLNESLRLANEGGLSKRDTELLTIAALVHDAGFLSQHHDNEHIGARIAENAMAEANEYSREEIELVSQMILDTKLVLEDCAQISKTRLSPYLLDADLSNLGRKVFWIQTRAVASELGVPFEKFVPVTGALMARHRWQSTAGIRLYDDQKVINLEELNSLVSTEK